MKKILTLLAIFTTLIFAGCSDTNLSNSGIDGGTEYSGDIVGVWEASQSNGGMSMKTEFTFYSDGGYSIYLEGSYQGQTKWTREKGLYYVEGDIIAMCPVKFEASEKLNDEDIEDKLYIYKYYYVFEVTPKTLEIGRMYTDSSELDFEEAQEDAENGMYTEGTELTKK